MKNMIRLITGIVLSATLLQADLKTDLVNFNNSMSDLNNSIANVTLTSDSMCAPLIALNKEARAIVDAIIIRNNAFSAPITLDDETIVLTQKLFINVAAIAKESSFITADIALLQPSTDAITLADGIRAMLQLSSDIGEMADRIGEMADNILIMSDNIGVMADRILETQVIQSENLTLTQNSVLQTQTNTLAFVSVAETASYDLTLDSLVAEGNLLVAKMTLIELNPWNMASELADTKADVNAYMLQVQQFQAILDVDLAQSTMYINSDSLNSLVNLSIIMSSMGILMDSYGIMIEASKVVTAQGTLLDAMGSLLNLSADIGQMSNSILEMADQILLMSDNIGLEADQIILTQELQSGNIATTQVSILNAQTLALGIIASTY